MKSDFLRNAARAIGPPRYLGHLALEAGLVTEMQLAQALEEQDRLDPRPKLGELLVRRGWLDASELDELLKRQAGLRDGGEGAGPPDGAVAVNRLGRFHLVEHLGSGGAGEVWKAWDSRLLRWVAIKMLRFPVPAQRERFLREARLTAKIQHPNIIPIHEVDQVDGTDFLVMEFKDGLSLEQAMLPLREAIRAVRQICDAVAHLHEAEIVHRDIKPQNIILSKNGDAFLTDLGLARVLQSEGITLQGTLLGTPAYMAPEQAEDSRFAGALSDIYALGGVLYFMTTHRVPCEGETLNEVIANLQNCDVTRPRAIDPKIPRDVETIILRAMEREPYRRYPSARALGEDLDRYLGGDAIQARPVSLARRVTRAARRHLVLAVASCILLAVAAVAAGMIHGARAREATARLKEAYEAEVLVLSDRLVSLEGRIYEPDVDAAARDAEAARVRTAAEALGSTFPDRAVPLVLQARAALVRYDFRAARERVDRARKLEPGNRNAASLDVRLLLGEWQAGFARIDDYEPGTPGRRKELFARIREAVQARGDPDRELLFKAVGLCIDQQSAPLRQLCEARAARGGHFEEFAFLLGVDAASRMDLNQSEAEFSRAILCAPGMISALLWRATIREVKGDAAGHRADVVQAVRLAPENPDVAYEHGRLLRTTGDVDGAIVALRKALSLNPRLAMARAHLGDALASQGDLAGADQEFARVLEEVPDSPGFLLGRAVLRTRQSRIDDAVADLTEAIRIAPDHEKCRTYRARLNWLGRQNLEEAARDIDHVFRVVAAPSGDSHLIRAMINGRRGRMDEARADLAAARKLGTSYPEDIEEIERKLPPR